ncbi:hypothetical protein F511_38936 [Dorcoceras hygrometricum]|uniref:DUF4219 domain-containing protein n=1 Tax=Dorcoceras hygrometricum TaxID=472368 RepID=A0A2Z7AM36_9LAMI|nr:hypothetical protein F511_38936 [Dorcoceras hygrometricum]
MSTSHNKIPMFSKEDYDDWKIRTQAHLAAKDDDMWSVITDGPMKIMKINIAFATSDGAPEYVEKTRHEYTNEDKKKTNLDNVARDILVGEQWRIRIPFPGGAAEYGPFNPYIPIRSMTIGKSRVAIDPIAMHTSWRSNSDIASVTSIGYPRMRASGESSTTKHRLLHASGPHPIPPPNDPKTNQYNQDLGLIHSTNGNHLESPNDGSSIDHQVTIHLHAQNITMFPTNETWYFASQMLVSDSGKLILILTAQSTRNKFRIHSDY